MTAYSGAFSFSREGLFQFGFAKALKEGLTGEGMKLVKAHAKVNNSVVYVADDGKEVINFYLQPSDSITVNGVSVLSFEDTVKVTFLFVIFDS